MSNIHEEVIFSGFGGQGILFAGRVLAHAAMLENKNVSFLPSYGPEMRGGTANCHVIISDGEIGSPIINQATALVAMTKPSLEKFGGIVDNKGLIIVDSSLVDVDVERGDIKFCKVPSSKMASEFGNISFANVILLGKLIAMTKVVTKESCIEALEHMLPEKRRYLLPKEIEILKMGMNY